MTAITSNHPKNGDPRMQALRWTHVYSGKVRDLYTSDAAPGRVSESGESGIGVGRIVNHMVQYIRTPCLPSRGSPRAPGLVTVSAGYHCAR